MTFVFKNVIPAPLTDVDLSKSSVWDKEFIITKGQHYLVNASSGKGKSTFVNMLYGLRQDFSGEVLFNNSEVKSLSMNDWSDIRTHQIASVFQTLDLFPELTVLENIFIKNKLTDFKTEVQIIDFLKWLEIDNLSHQLTGNLSMGQQQRVAIARALCQPFEWLLLDEPFSHLDEANIQKTWQLIDTEVSAQKASVIITSLGHDHNINTIQTLML